MASREQIDILFKMHADIKEMKALQQETAKTKNLFRDFTKGLTSSLGPLLGLTGIAGVTVALKRLGTEAIQTAAQVSTMAGRLQVSTSLLQGWTYASRENQMSSEAGLTALQRFTRRLGEAQQGGGELLAVLKANNIALADGEGRFRSTEAVLRDYADAMAGAESNNQRLAMAAKAFDTEGVGMVAVLKDGSAALDQWISRAREAGQVMEDETIRKLAAAENQLERFHQRLVLLAGGGMRRLLAGADYLGLIGGALVYGIDDARDALADLRAETANAADAAAKGAVDFDNFAESVQKAKAAADAFDQLFESIVKVEAELADFGLTDAERLANATAKLERLQAVYAGIAQGEEPNRTAARLAVLTQELQVKQLQAKVDADAMRQATTFEERKASIEERKLEFERSLLPVEEQRRILTEELAEAELMLAEAGSEGGSARLDLEEKILAARIKLASISEGGDGGRRGVDPWQAFADRMKDLQNPQLVVLAGMSSMFDEINAQVQQLIQGTVTWGDALRNVGGAVLSAVIATFAQMAAAAIASYLMTQMGIKAIQAATIKETVGLGAAAQAAWLPAAIFASIATLGAAAGVGAAAFALAVLSGLAVASVASFAGGFLTSAMGAAGSGLAGARAAGGPVSGGRTYLVGERGPELFTAGASGFITPNDRASQLLSGLALLQAPTLPAARLSPDGGTVALGGRGRDRPLNVALLDNRRAVEQLKRDPSAETWVIDVVRRNRGSLA